MRLLRELIDPSDSGRRLVDEWLSRATNAVELLPCDRRDGERCLTAVQVTTRSPMGAVAYGTGGILIDGGWVRVLGAGCPRLSRSLASWNNVIDGPPRLAGAFLVGDSADGGFFALNGGRFRGEPGGVFYFAPDTLEWEDCEMPYSGWLEWLFEGDLERFYEGSRWASWRDDVAALAGDRAMSIYPFPSAQGPPIDERSRAPVPIEEIWSLYVEQLASALKAPG